MSETHKRHARPGAMDIAAWIFMAVGLVLVLRLGLLASLLAGLLVFQLVHIIAPALQRRLFGRRWAQMVSVAFLATLIIGVISAAIVGIIAFMRSDAGSLPALLHKMGDIVEKARTTMPAWLVAYLPEDMDDLRESLSFWLHEHAGELRLAGAETARTAAHILIGMIIGAMIALREVVAEKIHPPLARAISVQTERLGDAFRRVVFAQVRISLINTTFTAIYLAVALPLFDVDLPLVKTMIAITFIAGLLPVIGNLISNTVIVIASLAYSPYVAISSLVFLVVIHKLEYFLNARIIGSHIQARAWELLVAMLVMEAAFGLAGVAAAPIFYAYIKAELMERGLV